MSGGNVVSIGIAARGGAPMESAPEVEAVAGEGLRGDRYSTGEGTFSKKTGPDREITLIESEAIEALARDYKIELAAIDARRNLVTRGVALNHLIGRRFRVGDAMLEGLRLCEPCGHLAKLTSQAASDALVHRGGLRARVVESGTIRVGDAITAAPPR